MYEEIIRILSEYSGVPEKQITPECRFINELGMESFALICAVSELQQEFNIKIPVRKFETMQRVADIVSYLKSASEVRRR